ncbi:MAG: tripartite tricarboxylate transporter substrate-binding protein, partial [Betaproteobacteria bacterium]
MKFRIVAAALALCTGTAFAQYPSKPARFIVPFAAGGIVDIIARPVAENIAARWGQQVLVEPKPGANGAIAAELVAKAAPDGTLWFLTTLSHVVNPALSKSVPYHPTNDFTGVAMLGNVPALAVVHASVP